MRFKLKTWIMLNLPYINYTLWCYFYQLRKLESQFRTALKQINPPIEPESKWDDVSISFHHYNVHSDMHSTSILLYRIYIYWKGYLMTSKS